MITPDGDGVFLELLVVPRASKNKIAGEVDGRLKIQITAPPVDGQANKAIVQFLAKQLGVKKKDVTLVSGETGRRKRVRIAASPPPTPPPCSPTDPP